MVIVFDLDDTLYDEKTFVQSGFRAVADYLVPVLSVPKQEILDGLEEELQKKRDHVFDRFLLRYRENNRTLVKNCVSIYRGHEPALSLYPAARACLARLHNYPVYIVTDGNQIVQRKKFYSLGLDLLVRRCFFTYAHGLQRGKPSPYCFEKICDLEKVSPSSVVYIGDNPHKDFVGIKPLGFKTIRVATGAYKDDRVEPSYEAHLTIENLNYLDEKLLEGLGICKRFE